MCQVRFQFLCSSGPCRFRTGFRWKHGVHATRGGIHRPSPPGSRKEERVFWPRCRGPDLRIMAVLHRGRGRGRRAGA